MLELIRYIRAQTQAGPKFTLANLGTLFAVCENPGATQPDIANAVGAIDPATLTRHLNLLSGLSKSEDMGVPPLVYTQRNVQNRRFNDVYLTEEGKKFAEDFAVHFSKLMNRTVKPR
jgi:DNA-binding MarR family transcriptional regulator